MIKRFLCLSIIIIALVSMLVGCGASTSSTSTYRQNMQAADNNVVSGSNVVIGADGNAVKEEAAAAPAPKTMDSSAAAVTENNTASSDVANAILNQRKIIRNANVTVEVDDFDVAYGKIKTQINGFGFVQESNIKKEKVYVNSKEMLITKGVVIIRVDKDKFDDVLYGIKGLGLMTDENIKSDDVTEKFFDTDSRLRVLKLEESKLEQYLDKLTDPDTIFKTESRLTDIRQEIEGLTGTLKKLSDLVDLSTITINISEKSAVPNEPDKPKSYWERLFGGFTASFKGVIHFCGEFVIDIAQAIPVLILLGLLGFAVWGIYRKFYKKRISKAAEKSKNDDMQM